MRLLLGFFLCYAVGCFSQRQEAIDFTKIDAEILPIFNSKEIQGQATYEFEIQAKTDSIFLDAVNMTFSDVALNGTKIPFSNSGKRLGFKAPSKRVQHELVFRYSAKPKQTVYFMEIGPSLRSGQVWTQGQGKYTSHWLPSIDAMTDKIEFDLTLVADEKYEVIANGKLEKRQYNDSLVEWHYDMTHPMSSYLAAFVIGDFDKKVIQTELGVPIELYYEPKDSLKVEPTYRYTKEIFDFLEEEIGVAYPWQNYKQVPVRDFLYAGMENTTCTIFSSQYVIDSTAFVDKNYVNVNAHELAHQWFGNLVTEESGAHHWLHEGFATYYAYLSEQRLFGDDHFYWKLYQTAKTLHNRSENQGGEALTDPKASSLTFYEKGAWALVALRERVGDKAFKKGIKAYLNTYAFDNATITNFLTAMEKASKMNLAPFEETWLVNTEFPWEEVKTYLMSKSASLALFFDLQDTATTNTVFDEEKLMCVWGNDMPKPFKQEFLFNYGTQLTDSSLVTRIENESIEVRQALALSLPTISEALRPSFESMLSDKSYLTQETVLFKLWQAFPKNRVGYLEALDGVVGLPNKNVRQLWLTLALITKEFQPENKKAFYAELNRYTAPHYNFEVRQLAFQYLYQIGAMNDSSLKNLVQALNHQVWEFKKYSRNLIREMNSSPEGKQRLEILKNSLSKKHNEQLNTILNP